MIFNNSTEKTDCPVFYHAPTRRRMVREANGNGRGCVEKQKTPRLMSLGVFCEVPSRFELL